MATLDAATQQSLRKALYAYMQTYGGDSLHEARAIAGALLAVKEKAGELVPEGLEIEIWVEQLVQGFNPQVLVERLWDEGEQAIAAQARYWRDAVTAKVQTTLDAYIQKYVPDLDTIQIRDIVATVLPIVEDVKISRDEAKRLIQVVSEQFDWRTAVERLIEPQWLALAEKTMDAWRHRDVEASAQEVMSAYVKEFQPTAVEIGEGLVEQAVQSVTNNKANLDLDIKLDPETQKLLVKQVIFKFNLMEALPPPSKTALEIARQVRQAVARYRREQGLDNVSLWPEIVRTDDGTDDSSRLGGEMSVGIEIQPSRDRGTMPSSTAEET